MKKHFSCFGSGTEEGNLTGGEGVCLLGFLLGLANSLLHFPREFLEVVL